MGSIAARNITINNHVNILQAPEVIDLRSDLMKALQPFPDASRAAAIAFLRAEERTGRQPLRTIEATVIGGANA